MSDEEKQTESKEEGPLVDLTSLEFGPAWARGDSGGQKTEKKHQEWAKKEERGAKRQGGGGRNFGGGGGQRDNRGGGGQRDNRGGGGPRDNRGGGGPRDNRGGGGSDQRGRGRQDSRDQQRFEEQAPEGVTAQVMPVEDGLDALGKEILASGRTYAVFDLAKLVLGARERFNIGFKCGGDKKLYRCRKDGSVWLSKEDAIQGFWNGQWRKEFYEQVFRDAEPPKGNFQAVAKCGLSGEYLGPPNYHGYQSSIMQMHRERYADMSIDAYKRKIRMEHGEEAVAAWMEKMSKKVQYRPTGGIAPEPEVKEEPAKEEVVEEVSGPVASESEASEPEAAAEAPLEEVAAAEVAETPVIEAPAAAEPAAEVAPVSEEGAETEAAAAEEAPTEEPAAEEAPAVEPAAAEELLDDLKAVEKHFVEKHFDEVFQQTPKAWVPGGVAGNLMSPGLLTLLRQTVAEERRYPGKLTPMLCRQLSGRHVAVFKWRKKLKAGPARPHAVPEDIILADRPQRLLAWLKENSGKKLEDLWKDVLPEGADDKLKHAWYHDLHWVLNQGYALLISDSTLHIARSGDGGEPQGKKKQGSKKQGGEKSKKAGKGETAAAEKSKEERSSAEVSKEEPPEAEISKEEPPAAEAPKEEVPAAEAPVAEAPVVEAPPAEAPVTEGSTEAEAPSPEKKGG